MPSDKIVVVDEELAAGIGRERGKSFLRIVAAGSRGCCTARPVKALVPRPPAELASPAGADRHQTARIDRIERDIGALRRVDGAFKLRLVIETRLFEMPLEK